MKSLALVILFAGALLACSKKTSPFNNTAAFASELQTQANDEIRISTELGAAFNDVDSVIANATSVCGGAVTVDSVDTPRRITVVYSGNTCDALRSRTGSITISYTPGTSWTTAGDSVTVTLTSLVITRLADSKTLTFNGAFIYKNISGGSLSGLSSGGTSPVVHTLAGYNVTVTYDNTTATNWQFSRQRSYTYNSGLVISTLGIDSAGGIGSVADWGANRFGNSIITAFTSPLLVNQGCSWRVTGGQATMTN